MTKPRRSTPAAISVPDAWMRPFLLRLAAGWRATSVVESLTVEYNRRLRRSLARVAPSAKRITLHRSIENAPRAVAREILAHELAHLVVATRSRTPAKPHGEEWASLMQAAGFPPRRRIPFALPDSAKPARRVYVHTCPVCHATRRARRPVPAWRCAACVANGLEGTLIIEVTR